MDAAFDELAALGAQGIQLTPGNAPTPQFAAHVARSKLPYRIHHGFSWLKRRRPVWNEKDLVTHADSVHPPETMAEREWQAWLEDYADSHPILEIMTPGNRLGSSSEIMHAMERGVRLALDLSHLHILRCQGVLSDQDTRDLLNYEHIAEVHVSHDNGERDAHTSLTADTYGLAYARERIGELPVVLEGYMHKLPTDLRQEQLALLLA